MFGDPGLISLYEEDKALRLLLLEQILIFSVVGIVHALLFDDLHFV